MVKTVSVGSAEKVKQRRRKVLDGVGTKHQDDGQTYQPFATKYHIRELAETLLL